MPRSYVRPGLDNLYKLLRIFNFSARAVLLNLLGLPWELDFVMPKFSPLLINLELLRSFKGVVVVFWSLLSEAI